MALQAIDFSEPFNQVSVGLFGGIFGLLVALGFAKDVNLSLFFLFLLYLPFLSSIPVFCLLFCVPPTFFLFFFFYFLSLNKKNFF